MSESEMQLLQKLGEAAAGFAGDRGFRLLGPIGERHGSWEAFFCKQGSQSGEMDRFISLAFTGIRGSYDVELWVGAEDGAQFVRRLISQFSAGPDQLDSEALGQRLNETLERAMEAANRLDRSDLVDAYLPSRIVTRSSS